MKLLKKMFCTHNWTVTTIHESHRNLGCTKCGEMVTVQDHWK